MPSPDFTTARESLNDEIADFIHRNKKDTMTISPTTPPMNDSDIFGNADPSTIDRWPLFSRQDVMVTPAMSALVMDRYKFLRQRIISMPTVQKYADAMRNNTFKPGSVVTIAMDGGGKKWLVDGNHTMMAVQDYGNPFSLCVETRLVENESDAAVLYSTFEARKRSTGAHMQAFGLDVLTGVSGTMLGRFSTGLHMLEMEFPQKFPRLVDAAQRQALVARWADTCKPVADMLSGAQYNNLIFGRSSSVAMVFLTVKHQPDLAIPFWGSIVNNDALQFGSAAHTIHKYLSDKGGRSCLPAEQFAALAVGWNAYVAGRRTSVLKVFVGPIVVTVDGTPWRNRRTGSTKPQPKSQPKAG